MPSSDPAPIPPRPPALRRWATPLVLFDAFAVALDHLSGRLATRIGNGAWEVGHVLGAHRWREGWETNLDRGWRQYRGSRCTICDAPWEGW
jgi:hypothetical protein